MTVEQIPSDELIEMTPIFHRAFNAAKCNPQCHCCGKMIAPKSMFKLSTIEMGKGEVWGHGYELQKAILKGEAKADRKTVKAYEGIEIRPEYKRKDLKDLDETVDRVRLQTKEVMLCDICTPELFREKEIEWLDKKIAERDKPKGGCSRINGVIVH